MTEIKQGTVVTQYTPQSTEKSRQVALEFFKADDNGIPGWFGEIITGQHKGKIAWMSVHAIQESIDKKRIDDIPLNWWGKKIGDTAKEIRVTKRFQVEVAAMTQKWGSTFKIPKEAYSAEELYWVGDVYINILELPEADRVYSLKIKYPEKYPNYAPDVYLTNKPYNPDVKVPHSMGWWRNNVWLCLYNPSNGEKYGWNPSQSTAATIAGWAIEWCYAHAAWTLTGKWVGEEHDIDRDKPNETRLEGDE